MTIALGVIAVKVFGVPEWAAGVVGFAFCVVLAAFLAFRDQRSMTATLQGRVSPKLKLSCDPNEEGCVMPAGHDGLGKIYRIRVVNTGIDAIPECRGQLRAVFKDGKRLWGGDVVTLTFQPSEQEDAESKLLLHDSPVYLDVIFAVPRPERGGLMLLPGTKSQRWMTNPSFETVFAEPGEYVLTVAVSAPSAQTIERKYRFRWTANLDTTSLLMITV